MEDVDDLLAKERTFTRNKIYGIKLELEFHPRLLCSRNSKH